uniref:PhoH-like protein n=1 Tax=viral metagenome TaxID=1070528 RepID=A0A6C0H3T9_9ZZZZ
MRRNTNADNVGKYSANLDTTDPKKRGRKVKKQNEKEIAYEYHQEIESENEKSVVKQRKIYENMQYLSSNEKASFENKFTKPKNDSQHHYVNLLSKRAKKIIVATGPAGTGKTLFATEYGVRNYLNGTVEKLIFTRPAVSVDEDLGYLPGTLEEKLAPWVRPIYDILYTFIHPKEVSALLEEKVIEIAPLGYMRGRTFKNCWIVADEMQNSTIAQMKMLLTRLGENSRLVITGDLDQHDRGEEQNGLEDFLDKFRGKRSSSITSFEFQRSDIQREDVVKEVLDIYSGDIPESYKLENGDDEILSNEFTPTQSSPREDDNT